MSSCAKRVSPVINTCPVDKIPAIKAPSLDSLSGFKKLKPGKQEITVSKPFGIFFPGKEFADEDLRVDNMSHYAKFLAEQIRIHNTKIDKWKEDLKPKKKGWF